ncbi:LOW QUALITY PROTEIN: hypothetical protein HID58_090770 [Brassica napus]|uniref:Uncharacterized protein n=1 Tax=Brassica napus TaxID=3708 RepID=A0ABQ7XA65_BRANA|nr:LOW QUALITY PROTEIN: hypothetical protein HID58_090770 [Brassica napus]
MRTYKWIDDPIEGLRAPWRKNYYFNVNLSADALIDHASRRWNYGALNDNFVPGDVEIINRNQPVVSREDFFVWKYNKSGLISVKSAYWLASSLKTSNRLRDVICLPSINPIKEKVWALHTSPKLKVLVEVPSSCSLVDIWDCKCWFERGYCHVANMNAWRTIQKGDIERENGVRRQTEILTAVGPPDSYICLQTMDNGLGFLGPHNLLDLHP